MDTANRFGREPQIRVPIAIAVGERPAPTLAAAIDAVGGLSWLPEIEGEVLVATAELDARGPARRAAQAVVEIVAERDRRARVIAPDRFPVGALPLFGKRDRWIEADVSASGARVERIPVRRELVQAPALVGIGSIGGPTDDRPLAIGVWRSFVQPKLAVVARLPGDRSPLTADLALPFHPRLLVLVGTWGSKSVTVATRDMIAAELTGLAIRYAGIEDPEDRPRPWEDPVVQRATELSLGALHPSALDLRTVWAGAVGSPSAERLPTLGDLVAEALGVR